jgi:hypothetical protein
MKHTIYTKLLISYLIYGVIAFFIICTFTQHLTTDYIEKQEASNLYREASIIAGDYAAEYFGSSMSLSDFQNHMKIVADYMDAKVWVVSPDGELLMDSDDPSIGIDTQNDSSKPVVINGFDVTDFGSDNYMIGDFYGSFKHKMLSVFSPVNVSYQNIGYIVIHKTMSHITAGVNGFMNISFYTVAVMGNDYFDFNSVQLVVASSDTELKTYDIRQLLAENGTDSADSADTDSITSALSRKDDAKKDGSKNDTENDTSDASKEDDGKLHSLEGTVKIEDLIPVTAASNIKIYVKAVSAQGYTFTYDLFDGIVNQDITDFETTADISGGDYTVTDPAGSKYEP